VTDLNLYAVTVLPQYQNRSGRSPGLYDAHVIGGDRTEAIAAFPIGDKSLSRVKSNGALVASGKPLSCKGSSDSNGALVAGDKLLMGQVQRHTP